MSNYKEIVQSLETWAAILYLAEYHNCFISVYRESIGSDEWVCAYKIDYLPIEFCMEKRRCSHFKEFNSYSEGGGTYSGGYNTYEYAAEAAVEKSIKLMKF